MFNYLIEDFIPLCDLQAQMAVVKYHNKITIYGYTFNPNIFSEFKHYALNYDKYDDSKNKFDDIVREIYLNYKKEVENKNIDNK